MSESAKKSDLVPDLVIAVDGEAASGKGTIARALAAHYALPYLDTGSLYRAVGLAVLRAGADAKNAEAAAEIARGFDEGLLADPELRSAETANAASIVSAHQAVRAALVARQRAFAAQPGGAVLDGRDIGTVIAPGATAKIFVTAALSVRAERRQKELGTLPLSEVRANLEARDRRDAERMAAPMKMAEDAVLLDTSALDIDAAIAAARAIVEAARGAD